MKRKIFYFTVLSLIISVSCLFNSYVYADEYSISLEEFEEGQLNGTISSDMTYDNFKILSDNSNENYYLSNNSFNGIEFYDYGDNLIEPLYKKVTYLNPGDIFITNGTSSYGLTGHCGIAIGSDAILHIAGSGQPVSVGSKKNFYDKYVAPDPDYRYMIIYRCDNSNYGRKAANWAVNVYKNNSSKVTYDINNDLKSTNKTYCSKIVFQSYYYGVGSSVLNPNYRNIVRDGYKIMPRDVVKILSGGSCSFNLIGDIQE